MDDGWTDRRTDEWMDQWMDGQMDGWTDDERMDGLDTHVHVHVSL